MGSRIHREVYVRFRGEAMETYLGNKARRCGLSLQLTAGKYPSQRESVFLQDEAGGDETSGTTRRFNF